MKSRQKARKREMSKQAMREETERLVKEALERKTLTVKQGETRRRLYFSASFSSSREANAAHSAFAQKRECNRCASRLSGISLAAPNHYFNRIAQPTYPSCAAQSLAV